MKKRVLIIDDDEMSCDELSDLLTGESYEVQQAFDGLEGKRRIEEGNYDVVLLDLMLPGMSGFDLLKILKKMYANAKCLVLTSKPLQLEYLREGAPYVNDDYETLKMADGVMLKPLNIDLLLQHIKELLEKR